MKILGIDPGLRVCGYAVIEKKFLDCKLLEAGVFRIATDNTLAGRLTQIADDIQSVLEKYKPDAVGVEQLFAHYKHPRTAILMGHARGVILQKSDAAGAEVAEYAATRIKKSLTGNGRATKAQMQRTIQTVLALPDPPEPADVADAIAIALCCANEK
ncbi:MAG: crossover junction endodeoxyribonuclease RuvC [Planctomycetota bacterium]|jgi:crossover junction endodeoxyribonuclease RuvC